MANPTSPAGYIDMLWQKVKEENIVEATQIVQIIQKRIEAGTITIDWA